MAHQGLTRFSSSQPDICGGCNNPDDPNALTPEQQARTFTVLIEEASYFTLIIDLSDGTKKMPRSIYFVNLLETNWSHIMQHCQVSVIMQSL